jgi:hypothetical protein
MMCLIIELTKNDSSKMLLGAAGHSAALLRYGQ